MSARKIAASIAAPPALRHFQAKTFAEYESLFEGATNEIAIGEASPQYLRCPTAAQRIPPPAPPAAKKADVHHETDLERAYRHMRLLMNDSYRFMYDSTDPAPLDSECECSVCRRYSRAYIRHLYQAKEMLAAILISHHNLAFFLDTMKKVRQSIKSGEFNQFRHNFINKIREGEA